MKAAPQVLLFVALFFGTWFLLARIDFLEAFNITEFSRENERRLGDLMVETITTGHPSLEGHVVRSLPTSILGRLCRAGGMPDTSVELLIIDISMPLRPGMPVYAGNPPYERRVTHVIGRDGAPCNQSMFSFGAHCGTHIDAPWHFEADGYTTDRVPLDHLMVEASFPGALRGDKLAGHEQFRRLA